MGKGVVDIVANVSTGGLYGLAKGAEKAVTTGKITAGIADAFASAGIAGGIMQPLLGTKNSLMIEGAFASGALLAAPAGSVASGGFGTADIAAEEAAQAAAMPGVAPLATEGASSLAGVGEGANPNFTQAVGAKPGVGEFPATSMPGQGSATLPGESGWATKGATPTGTGVLSNPASASMENMGASGLSPEDTAAVTQSVERIKGGADVATEAAGWSPAVKSALALGGVMTAGQMATGALGGLFQGVSAQKRLELEQLINKQNQDQRVYLNRNNAFAPTLNFPKPAGVLAAPKGA
jgi:hypothetical protein